MTNHSIIRKGVRTLCVALLVSAICAAWPLAAEAKGGGGSHTSGTTVHVSSGATISAKTSKTNTTGTVGRVNFEPFKVTKSIDK